MTEKITTAALMFVLSLLAGCGDGLNYNRVTYVRPNSQTPRSSSDPVWLIFFKNTYFYPVRNWFDGPRQWARITGNPLQAKNLTAGGVPNSSFYTNRPIAGVSPETIAAGANRGPAPASPFTILKIKQKGGSTGFFGRDANGHKYLIKLDDEEYPELGSTASIVASRIYWALGYFVPETYLATIEGTGNAQFDGRGALASRFVPGEVLGMFKMDWVRDRREFRALQLVAAWLNDVDRTDNNTLVAVEGDLARFYLLDFNSSLGSWQGRPKQPWMGCRYWWDVERQLTKVLTLGVAGDGPCGSITESIAPKPLGYLRLHFDPDRWRTEKPNMAFDQMTEQDAAWMARKIAQFSREQLQAIVDEANMSNPADAESLVEALLARREVILLRYGMTVGLGSL